MLFCSTLSDERIQKALEIGIQENDTSLDSTYLVIPLTQCLLPTGDIDYVKNIMLILKYILQYCVC